MFSLIPGVTDDIEELTYSKLKRLVPVQVRGGADVIYQYYPIPFSAKDVNILIWLSAILSFSFVVSVLAFLFSLFIVQAK